MAGWDDDPVTGATAATKPAAAPWDRDPIASKSAAGEPSLFPKPPEAKEGERTGVLQTAPTLTPSQSFLQSHHDLEMAAKQRVNPNATSKYFPSSAENKPPKLGDVEEMDWGPSYKGPNGEYLRINPQTDFIARDPETGRLAVYGRTPQANESAIVSGSRLVMPGMAVGPVTNTLRALPEAEQAVAAMPHLPHSSAAPPAAVAAAAQPALGRVGTAVGAELAAERAADITQSIGAFDRLNIRKPPIAFSQGPLSGLGKMVSRIPWLGEPIHASLEEAHVGARDAARALSAQMAPNATVEQAGHTLQQGLDRFKTAGVGDIEPGVLTNMGIQPRAPGPYVGELVAPPTGSGGAYVPLNQQQRMIAQPNGGVAAFDPAQHMVVNAAGRQAVYENAGRGLPEVSAGAMQRAVEAEPLRRAQYPWSGLAYTNRGVPVEAALPLDLTIMGRRGAVDLSDAELRTLIRTPSQDTSFLARAEGLYEKARRSVPTFMRMNNTADPVRLATPNTRAALQGVESSIANQISGQGAITGDLAARLANPRSHFSLDDLFSIRTEVGRQLSNFSPYQQTLNRQQLNALYGGLSRDIEVSLMDIANRAYLRTRPGMVNQPNAVRPEVALRADQALRDFRVADRFFRASMARMERFAKVLGTENPQAAVGIMTRAALDGTKGDIGMLRTAMAVLRPEERQQFAALALDQMGKPKPNAAGIVEKTGFSPATFMTTWKSMNPAAKNILFNGEFRQGMDDLVHAVGRLNNVEALSNTSRSGTDVINFLTLFGGGALMMTKQFGAMAALAAPTMAFSFLMSRPGYVNWIAKYADLRAKLDRVPVSDAGPRMLILVNQLHRMALKDPALLPAYRAVASEHGVGERRDQEQPVEGQPRLH